MGYPAITRKQAQKLANELILSREANKDLLTIFPEFESTFIEWREGPEYDKQAIDRASTQLRKQHLHDFDSGVQVGLLLKRQTELEASMAGPIHSVLSQLEVEILQDGDFWRYLALFPFRWFLLARESDLKPQDFGGLSEKRRDGELVGFSKTNMKYQLLLRTYLWGKSAFDDHDLLAGPAEVYRRATSILSVEGLSSIDIWHSHIVRVQIGHLGAIPHAFVDASAEWPLTTNQARQLEILLTRVKHNVLLDAQNYEEARALVESQIPMAIERSE